jgi:hypothetical protein
MSGGNESPEQKRKREHLDACMEKYFTNPGTLNPDDAPAVADMLNVLKGLLSIQKSKQDQEKTTMPQIGQRRGKDSLGFYTETTYTFKK